MVAVYGLAALFLGWLVLVLVRVWNLYRLNSSVPMQPWTPGTPAGVGGHPRRLAVLLQNQADGAEGLVRRLATGRSRDMDLHPVLVDDGSTDDTALILERLARRFNLGFGRLEELREWEELEKPCCLDLRHLSPGEIARTKLP